MEHNELFDEIAKSSELMLIDAEKVKASGFCNRHEDSWEHPDFRRLKEEIATAGGNVTPIMVRRVRTPSPGEAEYEIVYGHRRARACADLALSVLALVVEITDQQLFSAMERENRERADLSPWEQGVFYKRALECGLFPSIRRLAQDVSASVSTVSTAVKLASLPPEVVAAFSSPLELQFRWAHKLEQAYEQDSAGVIRRANEAKCAVPRWSSKAVLSHLVGNPNAGLAGSRLKVLGAKGQVLAEVRKDRRGCIEVRCIEPLSAEKEETLLDYLRKLLGYPDGSAGLSSRATAPLSTTRSQPRRARTGPGEGVVPSSPGRSGSNMRGEAGGVGGDEAGRAQSTGPRDQENPS